MLYFALSLDEVQGVCSQPERTRQTRSLQLKYDNSSEPSALVHRLRRQYP